MGESAVSVVIPSTRADCLWASGTTRPHAFERESSVRVILPSPIGRACLLFAKTKFVRGDKNIWFSSSSSVSQAALSDTGHP